MADREINHLLPTVRDAAKAALAEIDGKGIKYVVTCTLRTHAEQAALYAQGRTTPGKKVTNANAGQSFHEYGVALDIYPIVNGKIDFSGSHLDVWKAIAEAFKKHGFEWAYEWKTFKEMPHFQMTNGKPLSYFQNGGKI